MEENAYFSCSTVLGRTKLIFNKEDFSDVQFKFKDGFYYSHKLLLVLASPAFAEQLHGVDSSNTQNQEIFIKDTDFKIFGKLLKFIHTDELDFNDIEEVRKIQSAAKRHNVISLIVKCQECIDDLTILPEDVCEKFESVCASQNPMPKSMEVCMYTFAEKTMEVFHSPSFLEANILVVETILKLNTLNIDSEIDVIKAIVAWGEAKSIQSQTGLRDCIKPLLKYIRFLTVPLSTLGGYICKLDILSGEEIYLLTVNLAQQNSEFALPESLCSINVPRNKLSNYENGSVEYDDAVHVLYDEIFHLSTTLQENLRKDLPAKSNVKLTSKSLTHVSESCKTLEMISNANPISGDAVTVNMLRNPLEIKNIKSSLSSTPLDKKIFPPNSSQKNLHSTSLFVKSDIELKNKTVVNMTPENSTPKMPTDEGLYPNLDNIVTSNIRNVVPLKREPFKSSSYFTQQNEPNSSFSESESDVSEESDIHEMEELPNQGNNSQCNAINIPFDKDVSISENKRIVNLNSSINLSVIQGSITLLGLTIELKEFAYQNKTIEIEWEHKNNKHTQLLTIKDNLTQIDMLFNKPINVIARDNVHIRAKSESIQLHNCYVCKVSEFIAESENNLYSAQISSNYNIMNTVPCLISKILHRCD